MTCPKKSQQITKCVTTFSYILTKTILFLTFKTWQKAIIKRTTIFVSRLLRLTVLRYLYLETKNK